MISLSPLELHLEVTAFDVTALETVLQFAQKLFEYDDALKHARLLVVLDAQLFFWHFLRRCIFHVECIDLVDD